MSTPANFNRADAAAVSAALQETVARETPSLPPRPRRMSATFLLLLANSLIFSAMLVHSDYIMAKAAGDTLVFSNFGSAVLQKWGSDYGPLTLSGQFWRISTSTFVHFNFLHLATNMLFLWGLGRYLDRFFTRAQALAIFLLTGAAASIATLIWSPLVNSAGASGAIYGQAGVLIALLCFARSNFSRRDIRNLLLWIILLMPIELLWGHVSKRTGYAAHLGGILCGFGIGILLARTFRLSPEERAARQRRIWQFAALTLVFGFAAVSQARRSTVLQYLDVVDLPTSTTQVTNQDQPAVKRLFLDLKGDPKLVHYFSGLLNVELENAGIAVAGSEPEADAVLHGEIYLRRVRKGLDVSLFRIQIVSQNTIEKINSCAGVVRPGGYVEMFSPIDDVLGVIRKKYPDARTVSFDPANDKIASIQFGPEHQRVDEDFLPDLKSKLKESGLTLVEPAPADIMLRINVTTEKVSVHEDLAAYDLKVVARNGAKLYNSSGTSVQFAKLDQTASTCSGPLGNPVRIRDDDQLADAIHALTKNLLKQDAAPGNK